MVGDTFIEVSNTSATATSLVSAMLQMELANKAILINTVTNFSSLVQKGNNVVKFPKSDRFTAQNKVAGTATEIQAITLATDDLSLNVHKHIPVRLEDIASMQSVVDLEPGILQRMMSALVDAFEASIMTAVLLASSTGPDHQIVSDGYAIAEKDILEAKRLLDVASVPKDSRVICVHANEVKDLLQIANFIQANRYPNAQALVNGELGMIYGMKVVQHNVASGAGKVCVYHPEHVAFAAQREPNFESQRAPLTYVAQDYSVDMLYGVKVLQDGILGVVITIKTP